MPIAPPSVVKSLIKLLGIGLIVAAAITYGRRRLRRARSCDAEGSGARGAEREDVEVVVDAVIIGIAEVDPVPLANVAGEGIDPDAVDEAHRSVKEQRERLPVPGKNVP